MLYPFFDADVDRSMLVGTFEQLARLRQELNSTVGREIYLPKAELARRLDIAEHTVKRRLEDLRAKAGGDVLCYNHGRGYYCRAPLPELLKNPFCPEEQTAIALLGEVISAFRYTPFEAPMRNALTQMQQIAQDGPTFYTQDGPMFFCLPQTALVAKDQVNIAVHFEPIRKAIDAGRALELSYYEITQDMVCRYLVEPYHLFCGQGNWYLYANMPDLPRPRRGDFALQRIRGIKTTTRPFVKPELPAILAKLRQRFGLIEGPLLDVAIRFLPKRAEWVQERNWHPSQQFEALPDGALILHMQCEGLSSLTRWVLGFGGDAVPLAPPELVADVRAKGRAIMAGLDGM